MLLGGLDYLFSDLRAPSLSQSPGSSLTQANRVLIYADSSNAPDESPVDAVDLAMDGLLDTSSKAP